MNEPPQALAQRQADGDVAGRSKRGKIKRIAQQPAFLLHQYAWSESSAIVELLTRDHGRITAVAKGAKRPTSNFRAVLLPLQLLRVDFSYADSSESDICAIRAVEWCSGHPMPYGDALLAGLYLNELLVRMLVRGEKHQQIFDAFAATARVLATEPDDMLEPLLRAFELVLLRNLGLLPDLSVQTLSQEPLQARTRYALIPEVGLQQAPEMASAMRGEQWLLLHQALQQDFALARCMEILSDNAADLKRQLRAAFAHYLGGELQTQRLMRSLRGL